MVIRFRYTALEYFWSVSGFKRSTTTKENEGETISRYLSCELLRYNVALNRIGFANTGKNNDSPTTTTTNNAPIVCQFKSYTDCSKWVFLDRIVQQQTPLPTVDII